ncbi:GbsR/MarR family transcriptional regulator [Methanococcoides sp. FTZ1]|uniref:GbsR/MarR family transcriptional regulator n=1 Tax=Methanococcoides sp. FTZ1 TaxID=3439061 RepID=UPI003F82BD6C
METAKKEFQGLVYQSMKSYGLDELSSKLLSVLYSSPDPLTLDDLSKMTGYSFSAVSAAMKLLTGIKLVEKTKRSGSKKLYFSVQRDMLTLSINAIRSKNEHMVVPALQDLPAIIERCRNSEAEDSEEMLNIIEDYYQQMVALELIFRKLIEYIENIRAEVNKR